MDIALVSAAAVLGVFYASTVVWDLTRPRPAEMSRSDYGQGG